MAWRIETFRTTVCTVAAALIWLAVSFGAPPNGVQQPLGTEIIDNTTYFDANTLLMFVSNTGSFANDKTRLLGKYDGLYFPRLRNMTLMFAAGLWLGAKVNGQERVTVAEYDDEYTPGPMSGGTFQPDNVAFHVYKIRRGDTRPSNPDYAHWPFDQGAPAGKDHHGNDSLDAGGFRIPLLLGDQALWTVFNDAKPSRHIAFPGRSLPLGVEVQLYAYANETPCEAGQTIYLWYRIINKGGNTLDESYISLWADPDLGDAYDDLVGCDTALSLGYCYNSGPDRVYGEKPPSVGFTVLQGPIVTSASGSAWDSRKRMWIPRHRNLPMTAFTMYFSGWGPINASETYNYLRGRDQFGTQIVNPVNGQITTFMVSGDPVSGAGWLDSAPADKRFMLHMGPLTMVPGDTQEVVAAVVVASTLEGTLHEKITLNAGHVAGSSDGSVAVEIVDPLQTTAHVYRVSFQPDPTNYFTWSLEDLFTNVTLLSNQSGSVGENDVDGIRVLVRQANGMKSWSIPSGTRQFTWILADWGLEGFNGAIGWASPGAWSGGGEGKYMYRLKNVLLKLTPTSTDGSFDPNDPNVSYAYRYGRRFADPLARPDFAPFIIHPDVGFPYQDFTKSVPLSAWDVESSPPRRLAIGFLENNATGGLVNGRWWPPDGSKTSNVTGDGPHEWLWIFDTAYSTTPQPLLEGNAEYDSLPFMYLLTVTRNGNFPFAGDDQFLMIRTNPNTDADIFEFGTPPPSAFHDTVIICTPGDTASAVAELRRASSVVRDEFMQGSCACASYGDPNMDGVINVVDVVTTIYRVFTESACEQESSCPVEPCDFDGNGRPDLPDVMAMINCAFMNGTGPRDPCR